MSRGTNFKMIKRFTTKLKNLCMVLKNGSFTYNEIFYNSQDRNNTLLFKKMFQNQTVISKYFAVNFQINYRRFKKNTLQLMPKDLLEK